MRRAASSNPVRLYASEMEQERRASARAMRCSARPRQPRGGRQGLRLRNVRTADHLEREVVPEEAAVIRRILDEDRRRSRLLPDRQRTECRRHPLPACAHRHRLWAMTGVREMVFRELYCGRIVTAARAGSNAAGARRSGKSGPHPSGSPSKLRPCASCRTSFWRAAHARLERTRQTCLPTTGGKLGARRSSSPKTC